MRWQSSLPPAFSSLSARSRSGECAPLPSWPVLLVVEIPAPYSNAAECCSQPQRRLPRASLPPQTQKDDSLFPQNPLIVVPCAAQRDCCNDFGLTRIAHGSGCVSNFRQRQCSPQCVRSIGQGVIPHLLINGLGANHAFARNASANSFVCNVYETSFLASRVPLHSWGSLHDHV